MKWKNRPTGYDNVLVFDSSTSLNISGVGKCLVNGNILGVNKPIVAFNISKGALYFSETKKVIRTQESEFTDNIKSEIFRGLSIMKNNNINLFIKGINNFIEIFPFLERDLLIKFGEENITALTSACEFGIF